jgi:hypothetical protein
MVVHLFSPNDRYDEVYIRNYATLQVKDVLARIPGAGDVQIFGSGDYAMRVWLNPDKAAARNLTANDIVNAIREQNVQVAAGVIGQPPTPAGEGFQSKRGGGRGPGVDHWLLLWYNAVIAMPCHCVFYGRGALRRVRSGWEGIHPLDASTINAASDPLPVAAF